ncbi:MAG: SelD-related putative sulfur metabolism protein [Candidatus Aramenus sulfurataquae]|jgi:selenophosphate synthase|uniref:SelD-related putative sulfur metabolism protein n=2 Tax=Candidatus Aramenus sulfurataquae TaxID=1326980 RepID=A0A0F2LT60_9CREN|nr:SelD-related putative sulfur metabolism protein [Candidatus Aramenus sulfurataquae]
MEEIVKRFNENLTRYKRLGLNPLSMATGCVVKVDLIDTVYPALEMVRERLLENNIIVLPREDADIFVSREREEVKRLIDGGNFDADRAVSLIQVNQETASSPQKFSDFLFKVCTSVKTRRKLTVGKGHSIVTTIPTAEVAVLDMFKLDGKKLNSYTLANNDTIQIVDPLEDPGSQMQVDVAVSNSLNDLFTKGAFEDIKIIPVYDGPDELKEELKRNFENFASRYDLQLIEEVQPRKGGLMIGATVIAKSDHELPTYYNQVQEGDVIITSRRIGELTPINLYLWALAVPEVLEEMEKRGIKLSRVEKVKREVISLMRVPNLGPAKVIYNHLPEFGKAFSQEDHIKMTTDVTGPGIFVVKEFAEKAKVDVHLEEIPVFDEDIAEFATENFIIPNSTAGTNGAILVFCSKKIADQVMDELREVGGEPMIIGKVTGKGEGAVTVNKKVEKLIHRKNVLKYFKIVD